MSCSALLTSPPLLCNVACPSIHKAIESDNVAVFSTLYAAVDWCETQLIRSLAYDEDFNNENASLWTTSHFSRKDSIRCVWGVVDVCVRPPKLDTRVS